MIVYWFLYGSAAINALDARPAKATIVFYFIIIFTFLLIGFRETGGDYYTYDLMYQYISQVSFPEAIGVTDPAYGFLNWASAQLGAGLYGVNAICLAAFLVAFVSFIRQEPRPSLALAIAMPYLIIVVAMGYTRQGTAIGLEFLALLNLRNRNPMRFLVWTGGAALFHATAVLLLPLVYFSIPKRKGVAGKFLAVGMVALSVGLVYRFMYQQFDTYFDAYVVSDHYHSAGGTGRSLLTAAAGIAFFLVRSRWKVLWADAEVILILSSASLALVPISLVASTAADRVGLYLLPLQVIVFGRLPAMSESAGTRSLFLLGTLGAYTALFVTWLHFGQFSHVLWLPYRSLLTGEVS